jgi:hypothetical protein
MHTRENEMTKRAKRITAPRRLNLLAYLWPGLRLLGGTTLIIAIALGIKGLTPALPGPLILVGAMACLFAYWIWFGRSLRRQAIRGRWIALTMMVAELCPVLGVLISFSLQKTDDGIPFIIGLSLSILLAVGMFLIVLLSFIF